MKIRKLLILFVLSILFILLFVNVNAYKIAIGGELIIDGKPASIGTEVIAKVNNIELGRCTVEKEGAYMVTINNAEGYVYKYVDLYVNGIKIDKRVMLKTNRFENLNIDLKTYKINHNIINTITSTTTTVTGTTINNTTKTTIGIVGRIVEFSQSNFATVLGILLIILLFISVLKESKSKL